jgi:uncharacterized membrane protein
VIHSFAISKLRVSLIILEMDSSLARIGGSTFVPIFELAQNYSLKIHQ